jgi:hypothetical protein
MRRAFPILKSSVSVLALAAIVVAATPVVIHSLSSIALAQGHEDGGDGGSEGHSGGQGGQGGHGGSGGSGGHEDGGDDHGDDHGDDGEDHGGGSAGHGSSGGSGGNAGGQGQGQGGPGEDSEGKGPRAGQGGPSDTRGGKPVWAQEGIPEVELGRLNVARSPEQVLDRAYDEALSGFTAETAEFYSLGLDEAVLVLSTEFGEIAMIDSPLQNLALLKDALDGSSVLNTLPEVSNDNDTLMAMFLGTASDKTVPITPGTVTAVTTILGTPVTGAAAASLATDAEAIRIAILAGHG